MLRNVEQRVAAPRLGATIESRRSARVARAWVLLLAVGASACDTFHYSSSAFFANTTRAAVTVRLQAPQQKVDCSSVAGRSLEVLGDRGLFAPQATYVVGAGHALPLDAETTPSSFNEPAPCASVVQLLGFADQLVYWSPTSGQALTRSEFADVSDLDFRRHSLRLEGHGELKGLAIGEALEVTALPALESADEPTAEVSASLGLSGRLLSGTQQLLRRDQLPDDCLSIELGSAGLSQTAYLCVPEWGFPFEVGQLLTFTVMYPPQLAPGTSLPPPSAALPGLARRLVVQPADREQPKVELWLNAAKADAPAVGTVVELGPPGRRTRCGAYVDPLSVEVLPIRSALRAGEQGELTSAGRLTRAWLGRADRMVVASSACGPEHASLGSRFDLLIVTTLEQRP